jgi:hypothetical protein
MLARMIIFSACFVSWGHSQEQGHDDTIIKKDDTVVEGKILRVTDQSVEVDTKGSNLVVIIPRSDVEVLLYSNDTVVRMSRTDVVQGRTDSAKPGIFGRPSGETASQIPGEQERTYFHVPKNLLAAAESPRSTVKDVVVFQHRKQMQVHMRRRILPATNVQLGKQKGIVLVADIGFQTIAPGLLSGVRFYLKDVHGEFTLGTDVDDLGNPNKVLARWKRSSTEKFVLPRATNAQRNEIPKPKEPGKVLSFDSFSYEGLTWSPEVWFSEFLITGENPHYYTFTVSVCAKTTSGLSPIK